MRQDEWETDFLQHSVRQRIVGFGLANDPLEIESFVKIECGQAKQARAITFAAQVGAPHVEMHVTGIADDDVFERRMSDGRAIDTPGEDETRNLRRMNHGIEIGTHLGG